MHGFAYFRVLTAHGFKEKGRQLWKNGRESLYQKMTVWAVKVQQIGAREAFAKASTVILVVMIALNRFFSYDCLSLVPEWRNGRRDRLKIYYGQLCVGSSPSSGNSLRPWRNW